MTNPEQSSKVYIYEQNERVFDAVSRVIEDTLQAEVIYFDPLATESFIFLLPKSRGIILANNSIIPANENNQTEALRLIAELSETNDIPLIQYEMGENEDGGTVEITNRADIVDLCNKVRQILGN